MPTHAVPLKDSVFIKCYPTKNGPRQGQVHRELLIYLIPGNPGLIDYYRDFLTHLASLLDPDDTNLVYYIVGHSLGGFELDYGINGVAQLEGSANRLTPRKRTDPNRPFSLRAQQLLIYESLRQTVEGLRPTTAVPEDIEQEPLQVVIIGHSVGAYLLMENVVWRQGIQLHRQLGQPPSGLERILHFRRQERFDVVSEAVEERFNLIGGVGLFPTIVDLAGSPRGKMLAPLALHRWFPYVMHFLTYVLKVLPSLIVRTLVKVITGMPWKAAVVTTAFLRSKNGVYQALAMARDELLEMTTDKWSPTTWNRYEPGLRDAIDRPQLYFFWGENDHWIANKTRDKVIADHARRTGIVVADDHGRPYMEVDNTNIPHDFCIWPEHSKRVAAKVHGYIRDTIWSSPTPR